jgi:hypothetical protein
MLVTAIIVIRLLGCVVLTQTAPSQNTDEKTKGDTIDSTVEIDKSIACPAGYYYSTDGARCYKAILEAMTWDAARSRCLSEAPGAQLVTVTDAGKNTAVTKIIDIVKALSAEDTFGRLVDD